MTVRDIIGPSPWALLRDYLQMLLGTVIYTIGYTTFLLPYKIVSGGVSGVSTILFYLTGFPAGNTYFIINAFLLLMAMRVLGWRYLVRTVIVTSLISAAIGIMQTHLTEIAPDGTATLRHILGEQKFMACVIGAFLEGGGLAIIFLAGGSTGGTDIIAMIVCKYRNISQGRVILLCDIIIIACGFIVGNTVEDFIYSFVVMGVCSYCIDLVLTGNKQTVQAFIFTSEPEKVADRIANEMQRGVTVINGTGWYTKKEGPILMVVAHKRESQMILRIVKEEDPKAFMTMNTVMGAYGKGFEPMKR